MTDEGLLAAYWAARRAKSIDDDPPSGKYVSGEEYNLTGLRAVFEAGRREGAETMREAAAVKADRQQYEGKVWPSEYADLQADARARAIAAAIRALPVEVTE